MPQFNVLYLVEKYNDDGLTDNRIIILYDEQTYYYYGTRKRKSNEKYVEYYGKYHEYDICNFINFLKQLNNVFRHKIDEELHFIDINEYEYDDLTFTKLFNKMTSYTEIFAYNNVAETDETIAQKLDFIKS
jgi:hypothetical protein